MSHIRPKASKKSLDADWTDEESSHSGGGSSEAPVIWVNEFTEESAQSFIQELHRFEQSKSVTSILIIVDSYGGEVYSVLSMIEAMEECEKPIITACTGKAMSAGALLLSAGDYRFIGRYSTVMIHQANGGGTHGTSAEVQADAKELSRLQDMYFTILARNCKTTKQAIKLLIKEHMGADVFFTAKKALEFGLVDAIGTPRPIKTVKWSFTGIEEDGFNR